MIEPIDSDMYMYRPSSKSEYFDMHVCRVFNFEKCATVGAEYSNVWKFYNDVACVRLFNDKYNFINRDGELLFPIHIDTCLKFFERPIMAAIIGDKNVHIAVTGGINLPRNELAKLMLKGN